MTHREGNGAVRSRERDDKGTGSQRVGRVTRTVQGQCYGELRTRTRGLRDLSGESGGVVVEIETSGRTQGRGGTIRVGYRRGISGNPRGAGPRQRRGARGGLRAAVLRGSGGARGRRTRGSRGRGAGEAGRSAGRVRVVEPAGSRRSRAGRRTDGCTRVVGEGAPTGGPSGRSTRRDGDEGSRGRTSGYDGGRRRRRVVGPDHGASRCSESTREIEQVKRRKESNGREVLFKDRNARNIAPLSSREPARATSESERST